MSVAYTTGTASPPPELSSDSESEHDAGWTYEKHHEYLTSRLPHFCDENDLTVSLQASSIIEDVANSITTAIPSSVTKMSQLSSIEALRSLNVSDAPKFYYGVHAENLETTVDVLNGVGRWLHFVDNMMVAAAAVIQKHASQDGQFTRQEVDVIKVSITRAREYLLRSVAVAKELLDHATVSEARYGNEGIVDAVYDGPAERHVYIPGSAAAQTNWYCARQLPVYRDAVKAGIAPAALPNLAQPRSSRITALLSSLAWFDGQRKIELRKYFNCLAGALSRSRAEVREVTTLLQGIRQVQL